MYVGEFKAGFGITFGIIIGILFIIVGIYMMFHDDSGKFLKVKGTIVDSTCVKTFTAYDNEGYPITSDKCSIIVAYKIDGDVYSRKMYITGSNNYVKDEPVDLMILKTDKENVQIASVGDGTAFGCIFVTIALFIIVLAYIDYYITYKYKIFTLNK